MLDGSRVAQTLDASLGFRSRLKLTVAATASPRARPKLNAVPAASGDARARRTTPAKVKDREKKAILNRTGPSLPLILPPAAQYPTA